MVVRKSSTSAPCGATQLGCNCRATACRKDAATCGPTLVAGGFCAAPRASPPGMPRRKSFPTRLAPAGASGRRRVRESVAAAGFVACFGGVAESSTVLQTPKPSAQFSSAAAASSRRRPLRPQRQAGALQKPCEMPRIRCLVSSPGLTAPKSLAAKRPDWPFVIWS